MGETILKPIIFVTIICFGYLLKKIKILKKEDGYTLATVMMNFTLPCALIVSTNGMIINFDVFILMILGIVFNLIYIGIGYFISRKENKLIQASYMINIAGFNLGTFVLPFVTGSFNSQQIMYLCSFDIGNALMSLGMTYAIAKQVKDGTSDFSIINMFKQVLTSVPFDTYIVLFIMAIFHITFPKEILEFASTVSKANGVLAMLSIGALLEIKINKDELYYSKSILCFRVILTLLVSVFVYFMVPLNFAIKVVLIMCINAPVSNIDVVFSKKLGYEGDMPAMVNSLSILVSITVLVGLTVIFL